MSRSEELFQTLVTKTLKNKVPAWDSHTDRCTYRGPKGSKCPVGHMIPDDEYEENMEGNGAIHVITTLPRVFTNFYHAPLVTLQGAHAEAVQKAVRVTDNKVSENWRKFFWAKAKAVASIYGYKMPKVDLYGKKA